VTFGYIEKFPEKTLGPGSDLFFQVCEVFGLANHPQEDLPNLATSQKRKIEKV
jgi:hypothetical protein